MARLLPRPAGELRRYVLLWLNQRLAELRAAWIVEQDGNGYRLAVEGAELLVAYSAFHAWADRWSEREGVRTQQGC